MRTTRRLLALLVSAATIFCMTSATSENILSNNSQFSIDENAKFIEGYPDGTFLPQFNMSRAEAITILGRTIKNLDYVTYEFTENPYSDMNGSWYEKYICFFKSHGFLDELEENNGTEIKPQAAITRGEFVQLIYHIAKAFKPLEQFSEHEFNQLVYNAAVNSANADLYESFSDVGYDNRFYDAVYYAVSNAIVSGYPDGTFRPNDCITRAEAVTIVNRFLGRIPTGNGNSSLKDIESHWAKAQIIAATGEKGEAFQDSADEKTLPDGQSPDDYIASLLSKSPDTMLRNIRTNIYKAAKYVLWNDKNISSDRYDFLKSAVEAGKNAYFDLGTIDLKGSSENKNTWVYMLKRSGVIVREVDIDTGKNDGTEVNIVQISDMHFNYINEKDIEEANPSILSTVEYRTWNHDGASISAAQKAMEYAGFFDQTMITGDTLDYLSWGAIELTQKYVWDVDPEAMIALGGHDVTRVMQGKVSDPTTLASRQEILKKFWKHDIFYTSKVIKDKVMVIQLDNGCSKYWDVQIDQLAADIKKARENGYCILIFEHEPICTRNPADVENIAVRKNDKESYNFFETGIGYKSSGASQTVYDLITSNADVIKGIFCGHRHSDFYSEVKASYTNSNGETVEAVIPQYILTANVYDGYAGHVIKINVK